MIYFGDVISLHPMLANQADAMLTDQLKMASPIQVAQHITHLTSLYVRQIKNGGTRALQTLFSAERNYYEYLSSHNFLMACVRIQPGGYALLDIPLEHCPDWLCSPEEDNLNTVRTIFCRGEDQNRLGHHVFVRLDQLHAIQDIYDQNSLLYYEKKLAQAGRGGRFKSPIILSHDRDKDIYYINDGHHRVLTCMRSKYHYIRGRVMHKDALPPKGHFSLSIIRILPHEEFEEAKKSTTKFEALR